MKPLHQKFHRNPIAEVLASHELFQYFVSDLKNGGIAAIPTDTLYGFAVDGESKAGVESVYKMKGREENKPLILFLNHQKQLAKLGIYISTEIGEILRQFWPGALTAIFQHPSKHLSAFSNDSLGIRVPNHSDLLTLLERYPGYLLTTSANRSGQPPISDPDQLEEKFKTEISWLFDGGIIPLSEPSTVADMTKWPPVILRQGKIHI